MSGIQFSDPEDEEDCHVFPFVEIEYRIEELPPGTRFQLPLPSYLCGLESPTTNEKIGVLRLLALRTARVLESASLGVEELELGWFDAWKEETIRNTSEEQFRQEFECEFLGSTNTLISGSKLAQLVYKEPIAKHEMLDIYEYPVKGDNERSADHIYAITVDPAEGRNLDASSFTVFDVSSVPYKQVAKYNSSSISPVLFPTVIFNTAKLFNDAYVLIEINNTPQIADTLHQDLEYENVVKIETGNKKAQAMGTGFGRGIQLGLKMSPQVKRIGCSNLKTLIENDKLIINDFDTISQLTTFVSSLNSFKAEEGANDDIVMTLVMFAWMTTQQYFKEIVNHDLRKQMQLEMLNQSDEEMPSFGIFDDGTDKNYIVEGGDVWMTKEDEKGPSTFFMN